MNGIFCVISSLPKDLLFRTYSVQTVYFFLPFKVCKLLNILPYLVLDSQLNVGQDSGIYYQPGRNVTISFIKEGWCQAFIGGTSYISS